MMMSLLVHRRIVMWKYGRSQRVVWQKRWQMPLLNCKDIKEELDWWSGTLQHKIFYLVQVCSWNYFFSKFLSWSTSFNSPHPKGSHELLPSFHLLQVVCFLLVLRFTPPKSNKTDLLDITEILLKEALNTINHDRSRWPAKVYSGNI